MTELPTGGSIAGSKLDEVFDALAHRHRRDALRVFRSNEGTVTEADLAGEVATRADADGRSSTGRERVAAALHHVHVPKLAATGLVTVDGGTVRLSAGDEVWRLVMALLERAE